MTQKKEEIRRRIQEDKVDYILAQFVDMNGTPKCKGVPATHFDDLVDTGAGFAGAAVIGLGQGPHDPDFLAMPDLESYTPVVWEEGVARFACDIHVEGKPWPYCSRLTLKRALAEARQEGFVFNVGVEAEHFLVRRNADGTIAPADAMDNLEKPCYDFKGIANAMGYLREMIRCMDALGWDVYQSDHEDANGQFEINFRYAEALTTADRYTFLKMMTSQIGKRHGVIATHMAKPFANRTGSGAHFHFHLADARNGENLFVDEKDPRGLGQSRLAYHFLGGCIRHARALTAILAPTVNCYKRLILTGSASGFTWVPAFISYGGNNRTQMFRTPSPGRFECRTVSAACNPYLALAALLQAGLDGVRNRTDPGDPVHLNMYALTLADIQRMGIDLVPQSLPEALACLEQDDVLLSALGERLAQEFLGVKRDEWTRYHNVVTQWEVDRYLQLF